MTACACLAYQLPSLVNGLQAFARKCWDDGVPGKKCRSRAPSCCKRSAAFLILSRRSEEPAVSGCKFDIYFALLCTSDRLSRSFYVYV